MSVIRPSNSDMARLSIKIGVDFANANTNEDSNNNRGFQIDRVEKVWGLVGLSYCAMFQFWDFAKAYAQLAGINFDEDSAVGVFRGLRNVISSEYLTFDPAVVTMVDHAKEDHVWRSPSHGFGNMMAGEYICYDWSKGTRSDEHHIEQIISVSGDLSQVKTLGANTSGGGRLDESTNDPKMGGVHVKTRNLDDNVMGWIGWRRGV